jgi:hypothetical protein
MGAFVAVPVAALITSTLSNDARSYEVAPVAVPPGREPPVARRRRGTDPTGTVSEPDDVRTET